MKTKEQILEEWTEFKRPNMKTTTRLEDYRRDIKRFLEHCTKPLNEYQETDLVNFLNSQTKRYNTRSMNELKVLLRNFVIWYFPDYSQRFRNLPTILRHLKVAPTYSSTDMLSRDEVEKIVKGEESTYWKTFWLVQFYGGMRPSETASLKWKDITFSPDGAFIDIFAKKNNKRFKKFVPENISFYLKKLKESSTSELVFPSRVKQDGRDMPMQRNGINKRLKKLSLKVLGKAVNPYKLRHSIATILYNEDGNDKDFVAEQMGHSRNMEKTYSHLSDDKIREKLKKLYIKTEDLPEKKLALEKKVEKLSEILGIVLSSKISGVDVQGKDKSKIAGLIAEIGLISQ